MKKAVTRTSSIIIAMIMIMGISFPVFGEENTDYTQALSSLGLIKGNGNNFDTIPTRAETLVMLIRLLGAEDEAQKERKKSHFADSIWAEPYIAFAYEKGLTTGISETHFGSDLPSTSQQYCTYLLRALGYSDKKQFTYDNAQEFASIVLGVYDIKKEFTRNEMARLSWFAINTRCYNSTETLADLLIKRNIFTKSSYNSAISSLTSKQPTTTTILIYMIGSDLETLQGRATKDLEEILSAPENPNIKVIIQTGGTKNWENEVIPDGKSQRFLVEDKKLKPLNTPDDAKMTTSETLTSFIEFGKKNYSSQRYMLILWDHGEGTLGGFGRDELDNNNTMRISELQKGIRNANVHFDIILFDACLMGTMEVAYALRDYGDYMLASEDLTPADGVYYTTWLSALTSRPQLSSQLLSTLIVDSFEIHNVSQPTLQVTMSVIRLDLIEEVYNNIFKMLCQITDDVKLNAFMKALNSSYVMGASDGGYDQFDIISLASLSTLEGASEVGAAVQSAVSYMCCDYSYQTLGLALYIPRNHLEKYKIVRNDLKQCGFENAYLMLLDKFIYKEEKQ